MRAAGSTSCSTRTASSATIRPRHCRPSSSGSPRRSALPCGTVRAGASMGVAHTCARTPTHTHTHTRAHLRARTHTHTHTHTRSSIARACTIAHALRRTNPVAWRLLRSFSVSAAAQVGPQRLGVACYMLHEAPRMLHVAAALQMTIMSAVEGGKRTVSDGCGNHMHARRNVQRRKR